jgi:hypothetical protein
MTPGGKPLYFAIDRLGQAVTASTCVACAEASESVTEATTAIIDLHLLRQARSTVLRITSPGQQAS